MRGDRYPCRPARRPTGDVVVPHLRARRIAEDAGVHIREMRHVEEVLDDARPARWRRHRARTTPCAAPGRRIRETAAPVRRACRGRPTPARTSPCTWYAPHAGLRRAGAVRAAPASPCSARRVEMPAVVGADHFVAFDLADGQPGAAVRAAVLPGVGLAAAIAPQHEFAAEQAVPAAACRRPAPD